MQINTLTPWRRRRPMAFHGPDRLIPVSVHRLFDDFFGGLETASTPAVGPRVDLTETASEVVVTAELPGVAREDVELSIVDGALQLKGEKRSESVEDTEERRWTERSYGSFERRIPLPAEIAPDGIDARFRDGVLTVRLPKAEPTNGPRTIEIRSGD